MLFSQKQQLKTRLQLVGRRVVDVGQKDKETKQNNGNITDERAYEVVHSLPWTGNNTKASKRNKPLSNDKLRARSHQRFFAKTKKVAKYRLGGLTGQNSKLDENGPRSGILHVDIIKRWIKIDHFPEGHLTLFIFLERGLAVGESQAPTPAQTIKTNLKTEKCFFQL